MVNVALRGATLPTSYEKKMCVHLCQTITTDALADTQHVLAFIAHMAPTHFQLCRLQM